MVCQKKVGPNKPSSLMMVPSSTFIKIFLKVRNLHFSLRFFFLESIADLAELPAEVVAKPCPVEMAHQGSCGKQTAATRRGPPSSSTAHVAWFEHNYEAVSAGSGGRCQWSRLNEVREMSQHSSEGHSPLQSIMHSLSYWANGRDEPLWYRSHVPRHDERSERLQHPK